MEEEKRVLVERHRELESWEKAIHSAMLISYSVKPVEELLKLAELTWSRDIDSS